MPAMSPITLNNGAANLVFNPERIENGVATYVYKPSSLSMYWNTLTISRRVPRPNARGAVDPRSKNKIRAVIEIPVVETVNGVANVTDVQHAEIVLTSGENAGSGGRTALRTLALNLAQNSDFVAVADSLDAVW